MQLEKFLEEISKIIWGNYLIAILIGTGIFFTILTRGIQFRGFVLSLKELFNSIRDERSNKFNGEGTVSPIKALCTALSSCMGNGNIVGVATAIASGGPGAVFWMWISGILGMATKYSEILIGIVYREKDENGNYIGGPMYYLSKGLGWKRISCLFALLMLFQISGGALIQSNAVSLVLNNIFEIKPIFSGILMCIIIFLVINGGIKRLANVSEILVPIMSLIYLVGGIVVIIHNINSIEYIIVSIVKSAFNIPSVSGGVLGHSVKQAMRFGLA
ncbi:MAG: alanine/glycine:cation symporter family protein, partial [Fusobacteriaceae bacterium]